MSGFKYSSMYDWNEEVVADEPIEDYMPYLGRMFVLDNDRYTKWVVTEIIPLHDKLTLTNHMDKSDTKTHSVWFFKSSFKEVFF